MTPKILHLIVLKILSFSKRKKERQEVMVLLTAT